jgi:hypothetical protein
MKGREFKDAMYDGLAKMLKAISNPSRLEMFCCWMFAHRLNMNSGTSPGLFQSP